MKELLKKLWAFIVENKRPASMIVLVVVMYVASKLPGLDEEKQLLEYLWLIVVMGGIGFVPSFKRVPKDPPQ